MICDMKLDLEICSMGMGITKIHQKGLQFFGQNNCMRDGAVYQDGENWGKGGLGGIRISTWNMLGSRCLLTKQHLVMLSSLLVV